MSRRDVAARGGRAHDRERPRVPEEGEALGPDRLTQLVRGYVVAAFDAATQSVVVHVIWGTRKGRGPNL